MKKTILLLLVAFLSVSGYAQTPTNPYFFYSPSDIPALQAKMTQAPFAAVYNALENGQGLKFALEGNMADAIAARAAYTALRKERSKMVAGYPNFHAARNVMNLTPILDRTINIDNYTAQQKNDLMLSCDSIAWRFRDLSYSSYEYDAGTMESVIATAFVGTFLFPNNPNAANHYNYVKTKINDMLNVIVASDGAATITSRYMNFSFVGFLTYFSKVERNYLGNNSGLISDPRYKSLLESYISFLTPPNVLNNNLREAVGVGNTGWGEAAYDLIGVAAAEMKVIDLDLARRMQQAWIATGSVYSGWFGGGPKVFTLISTDPTIVPDNSYIYTSKIFNKFGYYVYRNDYGTPNESFLLSALPANDFTHSDYDCGSFSLYAYNTPLLLDAGVGNYDAIDVPYFTSTQLHNVVTFNESNGTTINGLKYGPTEVDTYLSDSYDYWRANITPKPHANKYYRSLGFLKDFSNTIITYDYVESPYTSQNNLHVFSTDTEMTSNEGYIKTKSHCYNDVDVVVDHLLPGNDLQVSKSRLGSAPSSWPNNLADANYSKYQQWLINKGTGDTQYLTIIRPQKSNDLGTKTYELVTSNTNVSLYKVKELSTNQYFIIAVNKDKSPSNQIVNFNASVNLKDIRTNSVYQPSNGTISISVPFASFVVLIPESMPTQDTGPGISSTNPLTPTIVNPDPSTDPNSEISSIGINTIIPHSSSRLDIVSKNKGFLPPRLTNSQMNSITNPAEGLLVFCTDCPVKSLYFFDGQNWLPTDGSTMYKNVGLPVATVSNSNFSVGASINLSCTPGLWSGSPQPLLSYQWKQNGVNISGATAATLTIVATANAVYSCVVTASNSANTVSISSNAISVFQQVPSSIQLPIITLQDNEATLSTLASFNNTQGTTTYQWLLNGVAISGANSTILNILPEYYGGILSLNAINYNNIGTTTVTSNSIVLPKILDKVTGAKVAFSLRKLSSTYTGSAIKVRRSSDNNTLDIGFNSSGQLDQATLTAFVGAGDGFVERWYDQSGNGRDVFNLTLASQPKIVTAGVVETQNGKPAVLYSTTTKLVSATDASWLNGNPQSFFGVTKNLSGGGYIVGTEYGGTSNTLGLGIPNGFMKVQFFFNDGQWGLNTAPNSANPWITTILFTAPGSKGYLNGYSTGGSTGPTVTGMTAAKKYVVGSGVSMSLFEIVHYSDILSVTDRNNLIKNQGAYFGSELNLSFF